MIKTIQSRFALSENGAREFLKGVLFTTLLNLALMLPAVYLFAFLDEYLPIVLSKSAAKECRTIYYIALGAVLMSVMYVIAILQYRSTYTSVYEESANRRISLAEKLRKLPLAFFGEKNLSDLTSTIMEDSTELEHTFSHAVPQVFASIISITIIATGLFIFDWRLSMALFWVVPTAAAIIIISKKVQYNIFHSSYKAKRQVTEKIQEGLETIQEIKSYNKETEYQSELDILLDNYEKILIKGELRKRLINHIFFWPIICVILLLHYF